MEEDQIFQYTVFPDLHVTYQQPEAKACLRTHWQGQFSSLPDEILILAWASLLQAFTRVPNPVFLWNGQPITVDILGRRWTDLQASEILVGAGHPTHLILRSGEGDVSPSELPEGAISDGSKTQVTNQTSLSFRYDCATGCGLLSTSGSLPESFLPELERQVRQTVCLVLPARREDLPHPSTPPSLSVLNPERRLLKGPLFLHELISRHWTEPLAAIDFLSSSGERFQITYSQLNRWTDNLAWRIANQRSHEGTIPSQAVIPVYIPQCPELYCAWIAVLKANAAFCPLGLDMPPERLKYILQDVGARMVLTLPEFTSKIVEIRPDLEIIEVQTAIDNDGSVNGHHSSVWPRTNASSDSLAYVMYTSGSTGVPKGVAIPHKAVTQALLAHAEHVPKFNRFLQFAAPTFDVSVFETFFPLFRGATLVTRHREHMLGDLPGTLRDLAVDAAELTPTVAGTLLRSREAAPSLKLLLTIGEMLTRVVIEEFAEATNRRSILLPMYGPTEASIHCTVARSVSTETKVGIIGRPLSTVTSLIIRETEESREANIEVLPIGQIGELVVAGQLATGYLNRPEQTEVAFRSHPTYGCIYRTGDRARLLPGGNLEYLGRISTGQVKIRGQRVELGEIEQVVCKAEGVQSAAAVIIDDIVVVFCPAASKDCSREQVMSMCSLWLPRFMRPGDIVLLTDNIPRLASGKIDKKSLETDYRTRMQATKKSLDGSRSQLEHRIIQHVIAELPGNISPTDDLWSSGLDSLKAIKIASRLRENSIWVSVSDLLTVHDIAELVKVLETANSSRISHASAPMEDSYKLGTEVAASALKSALPNLDMKDVQEIKPCTPLQLAMLAETSRNSSTNFNMIDVQFPDYVSVPAFCEAFQHLAECNDMLRSGFIATDAQQYPFCRIIWKRLDFALKEPAAVTNGNRGESVRTDRALLHPLKLHFVTRKERQICVMHMHHALYDGWSLELILQDLEKLLSGHDVQQRPRFDDVLRYQLQTRPEVASDMAHKYWQNHLQDMQPAPFPRLLAKQVQEKGRQRCTRTFALGLPDISSTSHELHVSRQSIVSAALAVLLSSYVGKPDIVFGAVSSGRTMPVRGIENIIGPCISTFPMRLDSSRLRTARDVINSTHRQYLNILQFDDISLGDIKAVSGIAGEDPLFDLLFVWQEGPDGLRTSEKLLTIIDSFDSLDYAVVLEFGPSDDRLLAKISFDTSKLAINHAMLFLNQLDSLLTLIVRFPETLVKDCYSNMRTEELSIENADICTFGENFTMTSTIRALAKEDPSRTAIEFVDAFHPQSGQMKTRLISYSELYRRAGNVSQSLASKGVSPDEVVSIIMEKSIELYVAILGVVSSGAAYLAIDLRTPPDRVRKILEDSRCRIVIVDDLSNAFAGICESHSAAELGSLVVDSPHAVNPSSNAKGGHLAYVVYTSGSTGAPKGVLITHSNVLSNIDCLSRLYPTDSDSKLLQACSQAFDVSVFEIFFTWHMGMSLCVATNDILFRDIEHLIRRMNISHLSLTPSVAALIEPDNVPSVKFLVTAGESMNMRVFNSWRDRGLYQGYGPSETTNICNVRPKVAWDDFPNNVGPPLRNTSIFVCQGQDFSIVPKGAVGKVWIGGEQVGRGYLHNDDLTRKCFVDHATYGRLYSSGDIGRLLLDGSLVILGRDDDQVKLRGQRIELGDIDQALVSCAIVKDSATIIVNADSGHGERLVSFWTPKFSISDGTNEVERDTCALFEDLEAILPPYMIPDLLIPIKYIPLTRQGKIDRRALSTKLKDYKQPLLQRLSRANEQGEACGALTRDEVLITEGVAEVVGCAPAAIHRDASFFGLGIDSISAIRLSQRLRRVGFGQVDISKILRNASVKRLATHISSSASPSKQVLVGGSQHHRTPEVFGDGWQRRVEAQFAVAGYNVAKVLPCTPLQEGMLSSYDIGRRDSYQTQLVFRITGDMAELERSWKAMVSRHQLLRTGFATTESSTSAFAQVVLECFTLPWSSDNTQPEYDLNFGDQLLEGCILPPYSLRALQDTKNGSSTLTLRMHHALYDGGAMNLLLQEVETYYLTKTLPPVVPFDLYMEYMLNLDNIAIDSFWQGQLDGHVPRLFTDNFPPAVREEGSAHYWTHLTCQVSFSTLEAEVKRMSTTMLSIIQTSWARLLSFYLQTSDVCFGNVYSGRNIPLQDADQIIGPCFNTLPLRVKLIKMQSTVELTRRLQETNASVLPYQPSSLRRIQKKFGAIQRPLFDTLLLLQPESRALNPVIWSLVRESGDMGFPVICEIVPDTINDKLRLKLHVQGAHIPPSEARRLLENLDLLLHNDICYNQASSADFSVLEQILPFLPRQPTIEATPPSSLDHGRPRESSKEADSSLHFKVRQILSQASDVDITEIKDGTSIFQLGLDSINAVQIAAKLRREGFSVTGGDILDAANMESIVELCATRSRSPKMAVPLFDFMDFDARYRPRVCQRTGISSAAIESILPCTSTQSGILAEFIHSDTRFYFNSLTLRLTGIHNINRLKQAWVHAVTRHEIMRTGFVEIESADHPFAMITYRPSTHRLPWKETTGTDEVPGSDFAAKGILESLHHPPWCLSYSKRGQNCLLKISILHALYDAQSLDLLLADVTSIYNGKDLPMPGRIRSALSAIFTQSTLQCGKAEHFFKSLGKSLQPTRFPDLRTSTSEPHSIAVLAQSCTKGLHELRQGCKQAGLSLQTAVQCAWARVLAAYTGERDVTFGIVLSGHMSDQTNETVAFPTMNVMPMALHATENTEDLVEQTAKLNAGLTQRQFVPLTQIKQWLDVKGDLFDTIVVLQQQPSLSDGPALWEMMSEDGQSEHAVSLEVMPRGRNRVVIRLTFQRNVLPPEQAKVLLNQYEAVLYSIVFSLDTEGEPLWRSRHELFSILPAKQSRIATSTRFLHEMVEQSVQMFPDKTALEFATSTEKEHVSKRCWTYRSLDSEANKVANFLLRQGTSPGDMIGICFDKCAEASFGILGILKAGCAFVAIDPNSPEARQDFILRDSACTALLCNRDKLGNFRHVNNLLVLAIDDIIDQSWLSSNPPQLPRQLRPEDTCYCLYTSGTTGQPKGCLISHDNAVQALLYFQRVFAGHWDENSRWLQFASFHFDVSVLEQFWSWSVGICVTSAPRDLLFQDIPGAIRALDITHLDLTPSLARLLKPEEVPSLCRGVFITGGEQLRQDVLDIWGDVGVLYNFYGPSEVTIGCTVHPRVSKSAKPSNIGWQFDNVGTFALDQKAHQPVLRGAIGELCLSGPLVGKGYFNRPELTEAKFEYLPHFGERIYHTGDLVRLLHDESFEFLGRADDQVKLRGQRLEIGEINHVLSLSDAELQDVATVVAKHPKQNNELLVSFLSWSERSTKAASLTVLQNERSRGQVTTIRQRCEGRLPGYMIPTYLIPVSQMPLSANNKVELKTLKMLFASTSIDDLQRLSTMEANATAGDRVSVEKITCLLSRRLGLAVGDIKHSSSLFELGMDSISIIGFSRSLKEAGFDAARPSLVMKHATVGGLAAALQSASEQYGPSDRGRKEATNMIISFANSHRNSIARALNVPVEEIEKIAPCTPLQEGMISKTLQTDKPVYAPSFTYHLSNEIDLLRLQDAWLRAQSKSEILRTRFVATADGFAQVIMRSSDPRKCSVRSRPRDNSPGKNFQRDLEAWQDSIKNLESTPWRVLLEEGSRRKVMVIYMFHALFDGISLPRLLENVAQLYQGQDLDLLKPTFHEILPFGPLCAVEGAKAFWQERLASKVLGLLDLPVLHLGNAQKGPSMMRITATYPEHLEQLRFKLKVTAPALFLASWLLVLLKHFGTVPILGVVVSGRSIDVDGAQNVIGPLFNTLPCFIDFGTVFSTSDLVRACHKFNVDSLPFQHTAMRDISKWMRRDPSKPLFDSLFVFQKEADGLDASSQLWSARGSTSELDFPLAMEVQQNLDSSFTITIAAQPQYLDAEEIHPLLASFEDALLEMVKNPDQQIPSASTTLHKQSMEMHPPPSPVSSVTESTWTPVAQTIRQELATLANVEVDAVRADSTIFELGLDSIDAIKLSARLKTADITLSVSTIMRCATVKALAETWVRKPSIAIEESLGMRFGDQLKTIERSLISQGIQTDKYEKVLPVTPLQEGMLANIAQYCSCDVLKIAPEVDMERLQDAWKMVIDANPILRTSFTEVEDPNSAAAYAQLVHRVRGRELGSGCYHLRELVANSESKLNRILENEQVQILGQKLDDPMFRLLFVTLKTTEKRFLVLSMAHAIYDGWSLSCLHQDVARCYGGDRVERPPYEPALWHILDVQNEGSRRFWTGTLDKVSPSLFPRKAGDHNNTALTIRKEIRSVHAARSIQDFCKSQGVTAQALGLSCYSIVLAGLLETLNVSLGLVLSGRTIDNFEEIMFPTMNTVIFPVTLGGSRSEMLEVVHSRILLISDHQFFPLRKAKALCNFEGTLFDALFIYQKRPQSDRNTPELYQSVRSSSSVEYPVNVEMEFEGTDLTWRAACHDTVLNDLGVSQLLDLLDCVLTEFMKYPNKPVVKPLANNRVGICGIRIFQRPLKPTLSTSGSDQACDEPEPEATEEWSIIENLVRNVLASVSGIPEDHISKKTSLFSLGLDSISSIKVSSLLRKKSISLPVSVMLTALTVERMAAVATQIAPIDLGAWRPGPTKTRALISASECQEAIEQLKIVDVIPEEIESIMPVTAGQNYVLGMWCASGGSLFYSDFFYRSSDPGLTPEMLDEAWSETVQQLPILRTTFIRGDKGRKLLQVVLKCITGHIIWATGQEWLSSKSNDSASSPSHKYISVPVQLLARTTPSGIMIRLSIHHALYDAVSLPSIISNLERMCRGRLSIIQDHIPLIPQFIPTPEESTPVPQSTQPPSSLSSPQQASPTPTFIGDTLLAHTDSSAVSLFLASTRGPATLEHAQTFWTAYLALNHEPPTRQPASFTSRRVQLYRPKLLENVADLEATCRSKGLSFQSLFLAAYASVHANRTCADNQSAKPTTTVVLGVYLANRSLDIDGLPELVYPTFNVIPLQIEVVGGLFDIAEHVQEDLRTIGREDHCGVSLQDIYDWTGIRIDACVNFLKLPENDKQHGSKGGLLSDATSERAASLAHDDTVPNQIMPRPSPFTGKMPAASEVYLPSVDIEVSIRDGGLDVGLFAPVELLDDQGAERVLEDLQLLLLNV